MATPPCEHGWAHWRYFLTCEDYRTLTARNKGLCERCSGEMVKICIDHDYLIGKHAVRGLLCGQCNTIVAMVERGERDSDSLTHRYLDSTPFHAGLPAAEMAERRKRVAPTDLPRPRKDAQLLTATRQAVVTADEAAAILGVTVDVVAAMQACGRLIGGSGPGPFRRVVVERLLAEEQRQAAKAAADRFGIPDLVSLAQAAQILGCSVAAAHKRAMRGNMPGALVGKTLVFRRVVVEGIAAREQERAALRVEDGPA